MRTFVTTYPDACYLLDVFLQLTGKFYGRSMTIDVAAPNEAKSDQLIRMLNSIDDPYLILLEEDFYLVEAVPLALIDQISDFCVEQNVDRFSLQSKNAHQFSDWLKTDDKIDDCSVYRTIPKVVVPFALEASVWKKPFLLDHLETGRNDGEIEMGVSHKIRQSGFNVCALDPFVMQYRDAMRGGGQIIRLHSDPLRLTVEAGNELALYPQESNPKETTLCL